MNNVEEKLKELIIKKYGSLKFFSSVVGIKYTTLDSMLKKDIGKASVSNVIKICKELQIDVDALAEGRIEKKMKSAADISIAEDIFLQKYRALSAYDRDTLSYLSDRLLDKVYEIREEPVRYITKPAFWASPSAGTGNYLWDDIPMTEIQIPATKASESADFVLRVNGRSMEPKFNDGDVVLVKRADAVDPGKIGIFVVNGEAVIKECGDGILHSLNPDFNDIEIKYDDSVKCLGEVIGKLN